MNDNDELLDSIDECECLACKNVWWVPSWDDVAIGLPSYCPFCGLEFNYVEEK